MLFSVGIEDRVYDRKAQRIVHFSLADILVKAKDENEVKEKVLEIIKGSITGALLCRKTKKGFLFKVTENSTVYSEIHYIEKLKSKKQWLDWKSKYAEELLVKQQGTLC